MTNPDANAKVKRLRYFSMLAAFAMLSGPSALAVSGHPAVPLPKPRPAQAPRAAAPPDKQAAKPAQGPAQGSAQGSAQGEPEGEPKATEAPGVPAPAIPQPSARRQALTEDVAIAPSLPSIKGPGACGGDDIVRLDAVVLPDKTRVLLKPAATLRCTMASAIADWVRTDLVALATSLSTTLRAIDNFDSFECRGRNRVAGAMLSEHGKANALDVRSIGFADGRDLKLTDRSADRTLRETVLHSVCSRFSTVLGPDSDWYHEDHIHLDLAARRNNYRICEWDVLDPMPAVAPMLPQPRPEEASPQDAEGKEGAVAAKPDPAGENADGKTDDDAASKPAASAASQSATPRAKNKGRLKQAPLSFGLRK
jgi:hypothetical protein